MKTPKGSIKGLRNLALASVLGTLLLVAFGNVVTGTGSGMGCGDDWPLCNGQLIPDFRNARVVIEYGHRVLAAALGFLVLASVVSAWRKARSRGLAPLRLSSSIAAAALVIQVILGAVTVKYTLPPKVVMVHLAVSMIFLASLIVLAMQASAPRPAASDSLPETHSNRQLGFRRLFIILVPITTVVIYSQIVLGAYMRHTGAGLACPDIPLCRGELIPQLYTPVLTHLAHRVGGLAAAGLVLGAAVCAHLAALPRRLRYIGFLAALLALGQIILGGAAVFYGLAVVWTTLHVATASVLFGLLVVLAYEIRRSRIRGRTAWAKEAEPLRHAVARGSAGARFAFETAPLEESPRP